MSLFEVALSHMRRGDRWQRSAWGNSKSLTMAFDGDSLPPGGIYWAATSEPWTPTVADILADDWHES